MVCKKFDFDLDLDWNSIFLVLLYLTLIITYLFFVPENELTEKAKSDKYELMCHMKDGWRTIPKEKIVRFDDNSLCWIFINGFAKNCILKEK